MTSIGRSEQHQPHTETTFLEEHGIDTVVRWGVAFIALLSAATALGIVET
jgi:hypothetical protein